MSTVFNKGDGITVIEKHYKLSGKCGVVDSMASKFVHVVVDGTVKEIRAKVHEQA